MEIALIGLFGVVIGAVITEYFRRQSRIEAYAQKVFERRLTVYEGLYALIVRGSDTATKVMAEDSELDKETRHDLISSAILPIAEYTDKHALFLGEEVTVHVVAMFMGVEDVGDIDDDLERAAARSDFMEKYIRAREIIVEESGLKKIQTHYRSVSGSKPTSEIIEYYKDVKKSAT